MITMRFFIWVNFSILLSSFLGEKIMGQPRSSSFASSTLNVIEFGARGNGQSKDTQAVQAAIDSCAEKGGGTVYFPAGVYLCGSLHLKSHVALMLDHGATIKASPDNDDFDPYEKLAFKNDADRETSFFHHALIWGEDLEYIAIQGTGLIDGNRTKRGGPKPIALKRCKFVTIKDLTILNAPNYAISLLGTDFVNISGVSILNGYCDGIDPDACKNVIISDCQIETYDDAIVPKASFSLGEKRATENLTVTNCLLATNCNCFKLGTESGGGFKYITVSNCVMYNRKVGRLPISGVSLESVDGGDIDGIIISNLCMTNVMVPIFLRLGNRGRDMERPKPGTLKNVIFSNIVAAGAQQTCPIAGIPNHPIEHITLDNIRFTFAGGGKKEHIDVQVPELISEYPEAEMFGTLPAYGFYCRHVTDLKLQDISLAVSTPDLRHVLVCEDVNKLVVDSFDAEFSQGAAAPLRFQVVTKALIRGCMPSAAMKTFIQVPKSQQDEIHLIGNVGNLLK